MFLLNGKQLPVDMAFTTGDGIQRPSNWLKLATPEDLAEAGIVEIQDQVRPDDRFYWVSQDADGLYIATPKLLDDREESDADGNPMFVKVLDNTDPENPVMVDSDKRLVTKGLKSNFIAQVKQTAGSILAQTDWMVIRKAERDVAIPTATATYRASVVAKATELEASITAVTTVEELASLDLSFPQA
jgi:hypothetical protein